LGLASYTCPECGEPFSLTWVSDSSRTVTLVQCPRQDGHGGQCAGMVHAVIPLDAAALSIPDVPA